MNCEPVVTAPSIGAYQPIRIANRKCRYHPDRKNCATIRTRSPTSKDSWEHFTIIDARYCSVNGDPYYEWLLKDERRRKRMYLNYKAICGVEWTTDTDEVVRSIDEAGERDVRLVRAVMRYVYEYLDNDRGDLNGHAKDDAIEADSKVFVLLNDMYVQCLYSCRQCIILPQEMYCLYKSGEAPVINPQFQFITVPDNEEAVTSQHIYKGFLIYNTVLTMMLKEPNPFNDKNKAISKVVESVGTCDGGVEGGKRNRIKVCGLGFGGEVPANHVMCPPKEMVVRIYRYAKWRLNPRNHARYFALLVTDDPKGQERLREWSLFLAGFKSHFFPTP